MMPQPAGIHAVFARPQGRPQREPLVQPGQIQPHPRDMSVVASAEATLGQVQAALAPHGQWLPLDGPADAPLRELVQSDSTGPLRLGFGALRDLLTGMQCLDGHGELITSGGIVVKNVAGYDLVKFLVGSHGCFGTPVTLTTRTYRLPEAALTVTLDLEPTPAEIGKWLASAAAPHWMLWTASGLVLSWLGREQEIERLVPILQEQNIAPARQMLEEDVRVRSELLDCGTEALRVSAPPQIICKLAKDVANGRFAVDPVHGLLWMPVSEQVNGVLRSVARAGGVAIWYGRDGVRLFNVPLGTVRVLEELKKQLDADGRLAPLPIDS